MSLADYIGKDKIFEGTFVINLENRKDRYKDVYNEFKKQKIDTIVEYLPAIRHHYGMVGCSLSHLECVKLAKQRGWKSVLIFEDDIVFTSHFEQYYKQTLEQLSKTNWAIFHFGAMLMAMSRQVSPNLLRIGYNWAAHAVAIHEKAYDFILSNYDYSYNEKDSSKPWGGHYPFDGFINKEVHDKGFEIYTAFPVLITQRSDMSDTWGMHRNYKSLIEDTYEQQMAKEVTPLVFSKNRPMQLDLLLSSYFKMIQDYTVAPVMVLYKTEDERYQAAYEKLIIKYKDKVYFVKETNFIKNLQEIVFGKRYVLFLVDDVVFYKSFKLYDGILSLVEPNVFSFSYRLGSNITESYITYVKCGIIKEYNGDDQVKVDWTNKDPSTDFGYPFEVSSSMYRVEDLKKILNLCKYQGVDNPNYFELTSVNIVKQTRYLFGRYIQTYTQSCAVSLPINRVQQIHINRCGFNDEYEPQKLLEKFEEGKFMDPSELYNNWIPNSVHVEVFLPVV